MKKIEKIIEYLENTPITFKSWCISFLAIIATRLLIESLILGFENRTNASFIGSGMHTLLFFLMSYLVILLYLKLILKENLIKLNNIVLFGQWIIILPPIIDKIIFGSQKFYSFYIFDSFSGLVSRYFHFFGPEPHYGITYGTRVEVFLVAVLISVYVWQKKKSWVFTIGTTIGLYTLLFILGAFPSFMAMAINLFINDYQQVTNIVVAKIFFSPLRTFGIQIGDTLNSLHFKMSLIYNLLIFGLLIIFERILNKERWLALIKNIRYPQMVFNGGLFFVGIGLSFVLNKAVIRWDVFHLLVILNLLLAIFSSWYFSVFINDLADEKIDEITNNQRPLIKKIFNKDKYLEYGLIFLFFSLSSSIIISLKYFFLIISYHLLTLVYSLYPFRLKRFVIIASGLSSFASLIFLIIGYSLISPDQTLVNFPYKLGALFFIGYMLAIPLKDFKDIEGDRKDGVYTLPVLLGEERARLVISFSILVCYIASVFVLSEKRLFFPAIFLGGISYWLINNKKIKPRQLNGCVLATIFIYGLILIKLVLLK